MILADFQTLAQLAAGRGLNTVVEGVALAGLSWCALRCFGARSSGAYSSMTRFAVWFATLLVVAGLPLLEVGSGAAAGSFRGSEFTLSNRWAEWLFIAWSVIAGALLIRLGFSLGHVYRLRHRCREIEATDRAELNEVFVEVRESPRRAKLLVSEEVRVPTALGFFRPAVVLPAWALRELAAEELRAIVLHELAHLRRRDDWTNLAQKFVKALLFFHPAVWWIDSRLALERETACDDMVIEQTLNARMYAASLISVAEKVVAEKMRMGRALALAQNALGRMREVSERVAQILDAKRARTTHGWRPAAAMIGTVAVIAVVGMPYAPEVISFQPKQQPTLLAGKAETVPVSVTPVSLQWADENSRPLADHRVTSTDEDPSASVRTGARRPICNSAVVVPAKARMRSADRKPKVVMTKAPARMKAHERLLVLRSNQVDPAGTVWMFSVWQYTSPEGVRMVEETIVMNAI
ncbi:MAG TPA: M56 family metallopeptidase [Terriglobales bacterium]|nr:M56 family metallopeptidase [Terriglobales bacterium]